ncbi:MAG TPA: hypothetical protein VMT87_07120 [Vicinamibacteria bacterium]|nr:hypothetical protein [Vicinamibacteria bacterium]
MGAQARPTGRLAVCAFFTVAGVLELGLSLWELPRPWPFWPAWEALGRALLHFLLAWGLWHRIALCRTIAIVYCLAAIVLYVAVLVLAFGQAPLRYPPSLVIQSLFQVPSSVLLFAYLRSPRAGAVFTRPLFG